MKREVDGNPDFVYHMDSTTVLRYIANEQQRFHVFVANYTEKTSQQACPNSAQGGTGRRSREVNAPQMFRGRECCSRIVRDFSFLCDVLLYCGGLDLAGSQMTTRVDTGESFPLKVLVRQLN